MRKDTLEKNVLKKCDLCSYPVAVTEYGNGSCNNCGWTQSDADRPDDFCYYNIISLNRARQLYKEGKPLLPNFEEFMEGLRVYRQMEFIYSKKHYWVGSEHSNGAGFQLHEIDKPENQSYTSLAEFKAKANINGVLLKDLWSEVKKASFMI